MDAKSPAQSWNSRAVAIAAMPSPRPVRPSPSVVVAERETGAPSASPRTRSACSRREPILGSLPITCTGRLTEEVDACGVGPLRLAAAEVAADVAEPRGAEHGVNHRVSRTVAVGVSLEACFSVRPLEPGEPEGTSGHEAVYVGTDADPRRCHRSIMPYVKQALDVRAMMD